MPAWPVRALVGEVALSLGQALARAFWRSLEVVGALPEGRRRLGGVAQHGVQQPLELLVDLANLGAQLADRLPCAGGRMSRPAAAAG